MIFLLLCYGPFRFSLIKLNTPTYQSHPKLRRKYPRRRKSTINPGENDQKLQESYLFTARLSKENTKNSLSLRFRLCVCFLFLTCCFGVLFKFLCLTSSPSVYLFLYVHITLLTSSLSLSLSLCVTILMLSWPSDDNWIRRLVPVRANMAEAS